MKNVNIKGLDKINIGLYFVRKHCEIAGEKHCNLTGSGFTLIELLVVVLIIGILAAVAVPQYQKAVLKTHYAHIKALTLAYEKAMRVYYMANNAYPTQFSELDVDLPAGSQINNPTSANCGRSGNVYCCLMTTKENYQIGGVVCGKTDYSIGYMRGYADNSWACFAEKTKAAAVHICKEEGGTKMGYNLPTPEGHKTGYETYTRNL